MRDILILDLLLGLLLSTHQLKLVSKVKKGMRDTLKTFFASGLFSLELFRWRYSSRPTNIVCPPKLLGAGTGSVYLGFGLGLGPGSGRAQSYKYLAQNSLRFLTHKNDFCATFEYKAFTDCKKIKLGLLWAFG